ncbi:hypothetical protein [Legionella rowbothamii]|uniref:hypothetical protein n=1 Tax=Legionella rowbothamii TaxID=96229 RepID=UPI0010556361|nr:hypothetical protein [Legionella rowbothamii]
MPFDNKLIADYTELINDELDNIAINTIEEYGLISSALQRLLPAESGIWNFLLRKLGNFLFPTPAPTPLPKYIEERVSMVKYYLDSPEDYVALPENYAEYKQIIVQRIKAKISEFASLDAVQKDNYMQNLAAKKSMVHPGLQLLGPKVSSDAPYYDKEFEFDLAEDGSEPENNWLRYNDGDEETLSHFEINMDMHVDYDGQTRWGVLTE